MHYFMKLIAYFMSLVLSLPGTTGFTTGKRAAALRAKAHPLVFTTKQMEAVNT